MRMLADLLQKEKATVVKKWFDQVLESYPEDTSSFLKSERNPFDKPECHYAQELFL